MKKISKILCGIIILLFFLSLFMTTYAANSHILSVVSQSAEKKYLENDQGFIEKSIINSNPEKGEVDIQLKLSNISKAVEDANNGDTEVFLVVDNSPSMDFVTTSGKTRKEIVLNSAIQLVESIYKFSSNVKVGLIDFHGKYFIESASIYNATVRQRLTDDKDTMMSAITKQLERNTAGGTNIDAGLQTAKKNFSKTATNKIIILLTDGIPNADCQGNDSGNNVTSEDAIKVQNNTKETIASLKNDGIYTITMLTGLSAEDGNTDKNGTVYNEENTIEENLQAVENVFGTESNPTADKFYFVSSANVDTVINKNILKDVSTKVQNSINNVKIVDYFPQDITDNFEFSYVGIPSTGTTTDKIDTQNKTITWDIGALKGNEVATLTYKLKLKDMNNSTLLEKVISTNEKVVLTYKDVEDKDYTVVLDSSPKVKLTTPKESDGSGGTLKTGSDPTVANTILPNTGTKIIIVAIVLAIVGIGTIGFIKLRSYKDIQ